MSDDGEGKGRDKTRTISDILEGFRKQTSDDAGSSKITIVRKRPPDIEQLHSEELPSMSTVKECSFCSRSFSEIDKGVEGETGVLICSDCIKLCNEILDEDATDKP